LYAGGVAVDWRGLDAPYARQKVALPTYPFQRQRFWIDAKPGQETAALPVKPVERWHDWLYELECQALDGLSSRADQHHVPDLDAGRWLILADEGGVGRRLADLIAFRGGSCTVVVKGESFRSTDAPHRFVVNPQRREDFDLLVGAACSSNQRPCRGVIHLWSLDDPLSADLPAAAIDTIRERVRQRAAITQALASAGLPVLPSLTRSPRCSGRRGCVITFRRARSRHAVGLGRAVALEHRSSGARASILIRRHRCRSASLRDGRDREARESDCAARRQSYALRSFEAP
jgi:hypothetical protein